MFAIYNNVTIWQGGLSSIFFCISVFLLLLLLLLLLLFFSFFFHFFFFSSACYLFKSSNYIITIIITIIFINITVMGVLEKSSGGEFQARNSSGMV